MSLYAILNSDKSFRSWTNDPNLPVKAGFLISGSELPIPNYNSAIQYVVEDFPQFLSGVYYKTWKIIDIPEDKKWSNKLSDGWSDPVLGIKLKIDIDSRNWFLFQRVLLQDLVDKGNIILTDKETIYDYNKTPYLLTVTQIINLFDRYGLAWQQAYKQHMES
jgi:hypothetical protein